MNIAKPFRAAAAALVLSAPVLDARAVLNAVDSGPYQSENGFFPAGYQDTHGSGLELCLSAASIAPGAVPGGLGGPACTLIANPGNFDPARPIAFPGSFPDESFWFSGDAIFSQNGVAVNYRSALEAAFASGTPVADGQRRRADKPKA